MKKIILSVVNFLSICSFTMVLQKTKKYFIDFDGDHRKNDFVNIKTLKETYNKKEDQKTDFFQLDFYKNSKLLKSFPIQVKWSLDKGEWDVESPFKLDSLNYKNDFVLLHNGFAACAYPQNFYLFGLNKNKELQLIHQWESYFDAPYGTYKEFKPINQNSFASVTFSIGESEQKRKNSEDWANVSKCDSIVFYQENNVWKTRNATPKNKIYWKKEMLLDKALESKF